MVYESDFYTTRRPYRTTPSYSTYTTSTQPSRQIRILPGLGKVHIVHSYDRIVPYVGHKRLTVVTTPPKIFSTRSSVLQKEYDWIENKLRPWVAYSPTNRYLNSDSSVRIVYVRNPITGIKYHSEYIPSRYYNFYRIIRPFTSYDDNWPYYTPLSLYANYRPYRNVSYLDDSFIYPLRLQRSYDLPLGYYKYYRPRNPNLSWLYYWPRYTYFSNYLSTLPYHKYYWSSLNYYNNYYPKRSYYWLKYPPLSFYLRNNYLWSTYSSYLRDIFDDETRLIRAQTASLLKQIHIPVPRVRSWPITPLNRYGEFSSLPVKYSNDTYIHRLLTVSPTSKIQYATYYTEPVKKYIGQGHLSCVSYSGGKGYSRRQPLTMYEDAIKNDIQLLSYYINKFRQEKGQPKEIKVPLSASRPSRIFSVQKPIEDPVAKEIQDLRAARAARLAKIYESTDGPTASEVENDLKAKRKKEESRLAEERAIAEEQAKKESQAKKDEAARKAELARQEKLAAQAAAERAAALEKQAEEARQQELAKQAEIEKARLLEEERARQEEQRRLEEEARAEEERKQLLRLEEIAKQAEEEREAELARQAEELAEMARLEAEREELERKEREEREKAEKEAELAELARQEAELAELERQERELAELAKQEALLAEKAIEEAEAATKEAELAEQEVELTQQANDAEQTDDVIQETAAEDGDDAPVEENSENVAEDLPEQENLTAVEDENPIETEEFAPDEPADEEETEADE